MPTYPKSLIKETQDTEALTNAEYADLAGIPESIVDDLRDGVPHYQIDAHFRTLQAALGDGASAIQSRVEGKRNHLWWNTKFEDQDRSVYAGLKTQSVEG